MSIAWLESIAWPPQGAGPRLWTATDAASLTRADYHAVRVDPAAQADWIAALLRDGIAFLRGVLAVEAEVLRAASLIGFPLETNYGRVFDVRPEATPDNLANSALGLGLHTDNPYREPVPGYQLLHCVRACSVGGDSLFVDGYAAVARLRANRSTALEALSAIPVDFRYSDANAILTARRTLIELDRDGRTARIHWNNRSLSTARLPLERAEEFYAAYREFAAILRSPEFAVRIHLQPGDLVAFDNGRVLHGRTPFSGDRLLQGCYLNRDGAASRLAVLQRANGSVDQIIRLLEQRGGQAYFGEPVSQLEHALQAAWLADQANSTSALVAAALLHDVGHLLHAKPENAADQGIDTCHEELSYRWLMARFGRAVAEPVRGHVAAKRYLCRVEPEYRAQLSPASVQSLALQGGPMTAEEALQFESMSWYREAIALRRWDDAAKLPNLRVPGLEHYRALLADVAAGL